MNKADLRNLLIEDGLSTSRADRIVRRALGDGVVEDPRMASEVTYRIVFEDEDNRFNYLHMTDGIENAMRKVDGVLAVSQETQKDVEFEDWML